MLAVSMVSEVHQAQLLLAVSSYGMVMQSLPLQDSHC